MKCVGLLPRVVTGNACLRIYVRCRSRHSLTLVYRDSENSTEVNVLMIMGSYAVKVACRP